MFHGDQCNEIYKDQFILYNISSKYLENFQRHYSPIDYSRLWIGLAELTVCSFLIHNLLDLFFQSYTIVQYIYVEYS